jgi:hypothetical protein
MRLSGYCRYSRPRLPGNPAAAPASERALQHSRGAMAELGWAPFGGTECPEAGRCLPAKMFPGPDGRIGGARIGPRLSLTAATNDPRGVAQALVLPTDPRARPDDMT